MGLRTDLQTVLEAVFDSGQTPHVYFQPPESLKLVYPCIVYERDRIETVYAENLPYRHAKRYSVTAIYKDPDSAIPDKLAELPMCSHDRHFTNDNLHHDVFTLYY